MNRYLNALKTFTVTCILTTGVVLNIDALAWCGGDGTADCAAIYNHQIDQNSPYYQGGSYGGNRGSSAPVYVPPKPSKYGAVAQNPKTGSMGMANLQSSKSKAKRLALADCGESDCKIISAYANTCMAHAYGSNGFWALRNEPSIQASEKSALAACSERDSNCQIFFSGCSLP